MAAPSSNTVNLTSALIEELACSGLTRPFAKLYGQHTRLQENQRGLESWTDIEAASRLNDGVQLIEAALIQREVEGEGWRDGMRRAGELLEWLSLPELNPDEIPVRLLAAATYQLAGYPARAAGLFRASSQNRSESRILSALLKADFVSLMKELTQYWARMLLARENENIEDSNFSADPVHGLVVKETVSCLGTICAYMRWGDEPRIQRAISKLSSVGNVLLYGRDPYSWLLSKLCAEVAGTYFHSSMRERLSPLAENFNQSGRVVIEQYIRQGYLGSKALLWYSQMRGVERLEQNESFALCTPTGSGKTTIAELAIIQSIFSGNQPFGTSPLVMYLVPSRALATEVESKLSRVMKSIVPPAQPVVVTGLYGGTDWGPTDVWLTSENPTVLICTYEKAEALLKFLGTHFLNRVSLVVIDEAHTVQFDGNIQSLQKSEDRALRLEALGARVFSYLNQQRSKVVALSAVASGAENTLAQWVAGQPEKMPTTTSYRSTRQIIGHLECTQGRGFVIRYDLLDGSSLEFDEENSAAKPYVVQPFPPHPAAPEEFERGESTGKRLRPYLLWAAMHLASPNERGEKRAVLISITEKIDHYTKDFLTLLTAWSNLATWTDVERPPFFPEPSGWKRELWQKCLNSCADYFGPTSREYRLLEQGIAVHHGKMPGIMARLLLELVQQRIVNLVVATSTLSEGVNLPFETVLIPSICRWQGSNAVQIPMREFCNLVGRAGRPGVSTEGKSFVLLMSNNQNDWRVRQDHRFYSNLINEVKNQDEGSANSRAVSPLATLMGHIEEQWNRISGKPSRQDFFNWLEVTKPRDFAELTDEESSNPQSDAIESLDSLDTVLLASIVELELIAVQEQTATAIEDGLQRIWRRTYAYFANQEEERLERIFIHRGKALIENVYTNYHERRQLYRTSIPPRPGTKFLQLYPSLKEYLQTGERYTSWSQTERFNYVNQVVTLLGTVSKFRVSSKTGSNKITPSHILCWWLCHSAAPKKPTEAQVSKWHKFVIENFTYRFNWGLGSVIALAIDEAFNGQVVEPSLENWPQTELPWIVFWLKELIIWGTLDPVAAYLLARVDSVSTRQEAEARAQQYYQDFADQEVNELLNASNIKNWVQETFPETLSDERNRSTPRTTRVSLLKDFSNTSRNTFRVVPVEVDSFIYWFDPAGFELARNSKPEDWQSNYLTKYDFTLSVSELSVSPRLYI